MAFGPLVAFDPLHFRTPFPIGTVKGITDAVYLPALRKEPKRTCKRVLSTPAVLSDAQVAQLRTHCIGDRYYQPPAPLHPWHTTDPLLRLVTISIGVAIALCLLALAVG
jgi:hypothetical protein